MSSIFAAKFLISCEFADAQKMVTLMEGCRAHADIEIFPLYDDDLPIKLENMKERFPHISALEETWVAFFPSRESLETFAHLLFSIEFEAAGYIRFVRLNHDESHTILNMDQFHKYIFVK